MLLKEAREPLWTIVDGALETEPRTTVASSLVEDKRLPIGLKPATARPLARVQRRLRARARLTLRHLRGMRTALSFAALLAAVSVVLFSPLLIDDLVFHASYLLRPSPDAETITQPTLIIDQPLLTIVSGTLSVPPSRSGQARTGEALAALIKGGGARLALKGPVIQVELSPRGLDDSPEEPAWPAPDLLGRLSPLLAALVEQTFETLTIRDGTILLKSGGGRVDTLKDVSADVSVKRKTAVRIKGSATLNGEVLNFDSTFGARIGRRGSSRMPIKAQIQSGLFSVAVDGRLEVGQGLALVATMADVTIPNVRSVARWFGQIWPSGAGLRDFSTHGSAEWTGQSIVFSKGTFRMDGNEGNGALSLTFAAPRPMVAGTLAFQNVYMTPYLGLSKDNVAKDNVAKDDAALAPAARSLVGFLKSAHNLTLPLIGELDADVRVSAESIAFGGWQSGRSALSLALRDSQLLLNLADMVILGGGTAAGEIAILGTPTIPNYTSHGRFDEIELADFTTVLAGTPLLAGKGQVVFDLKSSGGAGIDLLSRLSGHIDVGMPGGGSATCTMKELGTLALNGCRSTTALAPFNAAISTTNGVVAADRMEAMAGRERLRIEGTMDLVTSIMNVTVTSSTPQVIDAAREPGEIDRFEVRDFVSVRGRPDEPQILVRPR